MEVKEIRKLNENEKEKLANQKIIISDYRKKIIKEQAKKNWDLFYKRNKNHFFKDRHWSLNEFEELRSENLSNGGVLLEVGCGVGNFVFPLLESSCNFLVYACDFSPVAIDILRSNPLYREDKIKAFVADITDEKFVDKLPFNLLPGTIDIITLIFVLSAIHPNKMKVVIRNLLSLLKPGGLILFRDYGLYDHAMIRFNDKISDNFYVRQDGTMAYFFTTELVDNLFSDVGFIKISSVIIHKETINRKKDIKVPRVFVQSKFHKPH